MKSKTSFLLVGLSLLLFSCAPEQKASSAVLTGKVDINWSRTMKLQSGPVSLQDYWINRPQIGDSIIDLNPDGSFNIKLNIDKPGFYRLSHESDEVELFISPDDSIQIDFKASVLFSGKGEKLNNHLKSMRDMINTNRRFINGIEFYSQPEAFVDTVLDSLYKAYINAHNTFKNTTEVPALFDKKIIADITYRNKLYKTVHPPLYAQQNPTKLPVKSTYYEDLAQGSFNDPDLLKSPDFVLFLDAYLTAQSAGDLKFDSYFDASIEEIHPRFTQIQQLDANQEIKDYLLHEHFNKSIDNYGVHYLEDIMPGFRETCKNETFVAELESRFQEGLETRKEPDTIRIYKNVEGMELEAHIFYPKDFKPTDSRPAYVFFHGGGWETGVPEWGYENCKRYRDKGMVTISFEYRILNIHHSNILDCVRDVKSAVLWTRKEAKSLGIDPDKIVAAGFSAGGHLAACTAILNEYEEKDPSGLSSKPNALVIQSASYNTLKNNWFARNTEGRPESISTFHQVGKNLVPAIFFHGTDDHLAPISEFTEFRDKMITLGNDFEYKIFENVGHFFNNAAARQTVAEMTDAFLVKLGYIKE